MASPLLLLAGGAALLLLGGKKKRTKKKSDSSNGDALPKPPEDENMDESDGSEPAPAPGPTPVPTPVPGPDPEPEPSPAPEDPDTPDMKPKIGPSGVGSCANEIYNRSAEYLQPGLTVSQKAMTMFSNQEYFFYIRGGFQTKLYNYMLERFAAMKNGQERRTVASVVLRESLKHFNSGCKWEYPADSLTEPEQLVWQGGTRLAMMAQTTSGLSPDPGFNNLFQTGSRYSVTREALGDPDPGFYGAQQKPAPGRRVEILVTDKSQEHAEHIIGEFVKLTGPNGEPNLFEVRIIDKFQGQNVAPRLRTKHGFKTGSNAFFSQKGPTGIYRIFPEGMV